MAPRPPVVRSFAPPTGGYDSSDRKRSATRLALTGTDALSLDTSRASL
ncbi:hypothetical protein [uncultured Porphyromonas sp.]|nr:hypothetical protein [uncultured Porphyromonas sp.]